MQSIELLAHDFSRIAGMAVAGLLAAAGAINSTSAAAAVPDAPIETGVLSAPAPGVQQYVPVESAPPAIVFAAPLPGFAMNSRYGWRRLPGEAHARLHAGVDFAAPIGAPIQASAAGVVLAAGSSATYGNFVEVDHGEGVTTFYAHMSKKAVKRGEAITSGETLGFVGSTGRSTGPHLHFEIRKDERKYDPARVLGQSFASLSELPLVRASAGKVRAVKARAGGRVRGTLRG